MSRLIVNPITGELDTVLSNEDIQESVQNKQDISVDQVLNEDFESGDISAWSVVQGDLSGTATLTTNTSSPISGTRDLEFETTGNVSELNTIPYISLPIVLTQTFRNNRELLVEFDLYLEQFILPAGPNPGSELGVALYDMDLGGALVESNKITGVTGDFIRVSSKFLLLNDTSTNYELRIIGAEVLQA